MFDLIRFRVNYDDAMEQKLLEMDVFFQNHMWDGWSEDHGQFVSDEDFEAIQALTDKIKHMVYNIGCPGSVPEMLRSISQRKIKYWQAEGDDKGKQLKRKQDRIKARSLEYYSKYRKRMVIKGHFRWNHRAYTLSRVATDLLAEYLEQQ